MSLCNHYGKGFFIKHPSHLLCQLAFLLLTLFLDDLLQIKLYEKGLRPLKFFAKRALGKVQMSMRMGYLEKEKWTRMNA